MHNIEELGEISEGIEKELDEKDAVREVALKSVRTIIRLSSAAIRALHRGEDSSSLLKEAKEEFRKLKALLSDHPDLYHAGFVESAQQEMAEAFILNAIVKDEKVPSPAELGMPSRPYLMGLGDVVGELRRMVLERIRTDDIGAAEKYLGIMEAIYEMLMRFDYPSGLIAIRKKQDMARSLVEKTRGEFTLAIRNKRLEQLLKDFEERISQVVAQMKSGAGENKRNK
ncbi:MAG: translin family protein [Thermoplasmata archaeon]|nr:MAG: translin family protein [Thermoplasmata archaeon]